MVINVARREAVLTDKAPKPVGPYSQGIVAGGCFLFISGQIPLNPETGKPVEGGFEEKVRRVMENIKAIVEAAGGTMDDIVKVTVYLRDISKFPDFNRVYAEYFKASPPSRVVVEVSNLPLDSDLEVEAIAYLC
jgi:2-iminobutanoate/2-iminopropanoate deaminase